MLIYGLQSIIKTTFEINFPKCSEVINGHGMKKRAWLIAELFERT